MSLSAEEILQPWRHKMMMMGPAVAVLCAFAVLSVVLFRREVIRRTRSERAQAALAEQLSVQASTDGLTGLSNRRAFDAEFQQAFAVAVRGERR